MGCLDFFWDELDRFSELVGSIKEKGFYSVLDLLKSKSFHRCFGLPKSKASQVVGKERPDAPTSSGTWVSPAIPETNYPEVAILKIAR